MEARNYEIDIKVDFSTYSFINEDILKDKIDNALQYIIQCGCYADIDIKEKGEE